MQSHLLAYYLRLCVLAHDDDDCPQHRKPDAGAYLSLQKLYRRPRRKYESRADNWQNIEHCDEQRNYKCVVNTDDEESDGYLRKGHEQNDHIRLEVFANYNAQRTLCRANYCLRLIRQHTEYGFRYSVIVKCEEYRRYDTDDRCQEEVRQPCADGGYPTEYGDGKVHDRTAEG